MATNLIVGAGALGCVLGSFLQRHGEHVTFLVKPERLDEMSEIETLRVDDNASQDTFITTGFGIRCALPDDVSRVIIATKNEALEAVINSLSALPTDTPIISTLNGISHLQMLQKAFPQHQVTAATVMFNAQIAGILHASLNTAAVIHMPASDSSRLFADAGMKILPWDEARFNGKLVLNVVNAAGALTDKALNIAMADPELAPCFVAAIVEAGHCLIAAGLPFEMVGAMTFADYEEALASPSPSGLNILPANAGTQLLLKSSMIADFAAARPTEVNELNGEIEKIGRRVGFPTPINSALLRLVNLRSDGEIAVLTAKDLKAELGLAG